jgi:hypothetical protein
MISDAEQRRLAEIETVLRRDDPAFVRRFDEQPPTLRRRRILAVLAMLIAPTLTAVVLAVGGTVAAVIGLFVMAAMCAAFGVWRRRARPPRRLR